MIMCNRQFHAGRFVRESQEFMRQYVVLFDSYQQLTIERRFEKQFSFISRSVIGFIGSDAYFTFATDFERRIIGIAPAISIKGARNIIIAFRSHNPDLILT